jgi:hypothetical protein
LRTTPSADCAFSRICVTSCAILCARPQNLPHYTQTNNTILLQQANPLVHRALFPGSSSTGDRITTASHCAWGRQPRLYQKP